MGSSKCVRAQTTVWTRPREKSHSNWQRRPHLFALLVSPRHNNENRTTSTFDMKVIVPKCRWEVKRKNGSAFLLFYCLFQIFIQLIGVRCFFPSFFSLHFDLLLHITTDWKWLRIPFPWGIRHRVSFVFMDAFCRMRHCHRGLIIIAYFGFSKAKQFITSFLYKCTAAKESHSGYVQICPETQKNVGRFSKQKHVQHKHLDTYWALWRRHQSHKLELETPIDTSIANIVSFLAKRTHNANSKIEARIRICNRNEMNVKCI